MSAASRARTTTASRKFVNDGGVLVRFAGARMTAGCRRSGSGETAQRRALSRRRAGLGGAAASGAVPGYQPVPRACHSRRCHRVAAGPGRTLRRSWRSHLGAARRRHAARHRRAARQRLDRAVPCDGGTGMVDLPLSGLYVDMLRRVLDLASGARPADMGTDANATFPPVHDARRLRPSATSRPPKRCRSAARNSRRRSRRPRIRRDFTATKARRSRSTRSMRTQRSTPFGARRADAELCRQHARSRLQPLSAGARAAAAARRCRHLAAGCAAIFDRAASCWRAFGVLLLALAARSSATHARADDAFDMKAALDTRLAYVVTGVPDVDAMSKAGLTGLGL